MNITTEFAILNTETNKLLKIDSATHVFDYMGSPDSETEYSLSNHGSLGVWTTTNFIHALLVNSIELESNSVEFPTIEVEKEKRKVVAIHRINDFATIQLDSKTQNIMELFENIGEVIEALYADEKPEMLEYLVQDMGEKYEEYGFKGIFSYMSMSTAQKLEKALKQKGVDIETFTIPKEKFRELALFL